MWTTWRAFLVAGSKETAFIYAVTSAGVVHAVTQGCSAGDLAECSCDAANHGKSTPEGLSLIHISEPTRPY